VRRAALLYSSVFVMHVGFAAGYTGVPLLAKRAFGATVWELALLGLAWAGSYTFLCLGTALVAGRARPGVFALAGSVAYAAAYGSAALTSNLWHLAGVQLLAALAGALYWPMIEAAIARGAGGHRLRRRMGLFNISWSAGDALGAAAGGLLFDVWERLPFLSLPLISGLAAAFIVAALRRPEDELDASPRSRGEAASPARHRGHLGDEEKRPGAEARGGPGRRADQTGREEEEPEPPPAGRHERGGPGRRADQTGREEDRPGRDLPGGSSSPEDGDVRVREFSSGGSHPAGSALSAREGEAPAGVRCRFRRAAWLANFIAYGVVGVLRSIFAAPAADVFGMAPTAYGLVIGTFNGLRTVTFAVLRRWRSWHYRPRLLLLSIGLIGLSMAAVVAAAFLPPRRRWGSFSPRSRRPESAAAASTTRASTTAWPAKPSRRRRRAFTRPP